MFRRSKGTCALSGVISKRPYTVDCPSSVIRPDGHPTRDFGPLSEKPVYLSRNATNTLSLAALGDEASAISRTPLEPVKPD